MDQADGAALLEHDGQPSPPTSPLPNQRGSRLGLFFQGSEEPEEPTPATAAAELEAELLSDPAAGSPSEFESGDQLPPGPESPTSSAASPAGSAPAPLSKATLRKTTRSAIGIGSAIAHKVAAKTEGQQTVGLYIADEEDQAAIGDPLAEIAHRHGGLAGGAMNPDTADFLQSMFGMANYITKQVLKVTAAREIDAAAPAAVQQPGVTFHE